MAASAPITFFAVAIGIYLQLGRANTTDNQFTERNFNTTTGTALLAIAETGGFLVLFGAFVASQFV